MSSTRYASDPDRFAPERFLASAKISGINIGLNVIGRVARARTTPQKRAMVWLHNYSRLMGLTADSLTHELGLPASEIRDNLTNPDAEGIERFVAAVQTMRATYESRLPSLVKNRIYRSVRSGINEAAQDKTFGIIIGPERVGKSEAFLDLYLRHYMDRAILISCPEGRDVRSFFAAIAQTLGITVNLNKKAGGLREKILSVFSTGVLEGIFIDEMQRTWPSDLVRHMPEKIEFLRTLWDTAELQRRARRGADNGGGLAVIGCATPQFADDLNTAILSNERWKPGQFEGRMRRTYTPEALTDAEVRDIARFMAPEMDDASIQQLTTVTLASPGLLGFLGNVVGKARWLAEGGTVTPEIVRDAARRMLQGSSTEKKAKAVAAKTAALANSTSERRLHA